MVAWKVADRAPVDTSGGQPDHPEVVSAAAIALGLPGYQEWIVLLIVGLLVFGRRLPEVGRTVGKTVLQLRKGFQDFKLQIDADEELRDARGTLHEMNRSLALPRELRDPRRALEKLTQEPPPPDAAGPAAPSAPAEPGEPSQRS
jgi:TatA/E family protein of Tat protein translocase